MCQFLNYRFSTRFKKVSSFKQCFLLWVFVNLRYVSTLLLVSAQRVLGTELLPATAARCLTEVFGVDVFNEHLLRREILRTVWAHVSVLAINQGRLRLLPIKHLQRKKSKISFLRHSIFLCSISTDHKSQSLNCEKSKKFSGSPKQGKKRETTKEDLKHPILYAHA